MDNPIGDFFRDLFCSDTGCSYHPGPSKTEQHAKKIADELATMKEHMGKSAAEDEARLLNYVNANMDQFVNELTGVNERDFGGKSLEIDLDGIRSAREKLKSEVTGHMSEIYNERLVQTDKELSLILKEDNDKTRAKNFDDFVQSVRSAALRSLQQTITETVEEQSRRVEEAIQLRMGEVEATMQEVNRTLSDILADKMSGGADLQRKQAGFLYDREVYEILLDELGEGD